MSSFAQAMDFRHACKKFDATRQIPDEQFNQNFRICAFITVFIWDGALALCGGANARGCASN